jgi:hypothetical protein
LIIAERTVDITHRGKSSPTLCPIFTTSSYVGAKIISVRLGYQKNLPPSGLTIEEK